MIVNTKSLNSDETQIVFSLWNNEYPAKLGFQTIIDMNNYLDTLPDLTYYLLKNDLKVIEGWAMTFSAGEEKWFAITISEDVQRQGKGTYLLNKLKSENNILSGWVIDHENDLKVNGQLYQSPLLFYKRNGFEVFPQYRLEIPILSAVKITWYKNKNGASQQGGKNRSSVEI